MKNTLVSLVLFVALLLAGCGRTEIETPLALSETTDIPLSSPTVYVPPVPANTPSPAFTPTPQVTATTDPVGLQFIAIPEQLMPLGETFLPLDVNQFLRFRDFPADEMMWKAIASEHIALTITNGVVVATPIDPTWIGSETVQVEACEPTGACVTGEIVYSILDEAAFSGVRVTYVGSSGFLITVGDKKVLIDALFEGFPDGYVLPEDVQNPLLKAEPPFDNVDLILATHNHADHFTATMVRQHLQNNPKAIFISTTQAASQLADLGNRVIAVDPVTGIPVQVEANGIQIEAIYLNHGFAQNDANEIFNNGYIVTINDIKIFHTGDINALQDIRQYNLAEMTIDFAFISHVFLNSGNAGSILRDDIGADYLFPMHYEYTHLAFNADAVKASYPEAIIFYRELESWFMPLSEN